jgi:hypothetical protein
MTFKTHGADFINLDVSQILVNIVILNAKTHISVSLYVQKSILYSKPSFDLYCDGPYFECGRLSEDWDMRLGS